MRETSLAYQNVTSAVKADQPQTLEAVGKFAADNKNTYGALAGLYLAQQFVDKKELDKMVTQLQNGLSSTNDANMQALINLRLASSSRSDSVEAV